MYGYVKTPLSQFIVNTCSVNHHTKDGVVLNNTSRQVVFVYGTLMERGSRHLSMRVQGDAIKICDACTYDNRYVLLKKTHPKGRFPMVIQSDSKTEMTGYIRGEVYSVQSDYIRYLDDIESNGSMFNRTKVVVNDIKGRGSLLTWMYIGDKTFWTRQTLAGLVTPCTPFTEPKKFYYYTKKEHLERADHYAMQVL